MSLRLSLFALGGWFAIVAAATADVPEAAYIFPAGGQRGTTVDVRIGGLHLHDECAFQFDATDVTAPATIRRIEKIWFEGPIIPQPDSQRAEDYPSDYGAKLTIAPDAAIGTRLWRAATSQGVTESKKFIVGDLPEIVEQEIDGAAIPTPVTAPITINGRIFPREDIDIWTFQGRKGKTIRCEVTAERLGSPLDSQLEITDAAGKRLAVSSDHYGADSFLLFTPPTDGEYHVRIFDAAYGGLQTYVYRLTLSERPHVMSVYPLGAKRGTTADFELTGLNLSGKTHRLAIPTDAGEAFTTTLTVDGETLNSVTLETGDLDEIREAEPNDAPSQAAELTSDVIANGRIDLPGDVDLWAVDCKQGQGIEIRTRAVALGSPVDTVLTLLAPDGTEAITADDAAPTDTDSRLRFIPPSDGRYLLRVSDRSPHRGGSGFAYRLRMIGELIPDFALSLPSDVLILERGTTPRPQRLRVQLTRYGNFNDPIDIVVDGLPEGFTLKGNKFDKGRTDAFVTFEAPADAPIRLHTCTIRGVAKIDGREISRTANAASAWGEPELDKLRLAVALPTPYKVVGIFSLPYAPRGTTYVRRYGLERMGYDGPITIKLAEKQMRHLQGVEGPTIEVPAGATEFDYPVQLPPWMELSRTSRSVVAAIAQVDDGQGNKHWVSYTSIAPSEQISLIISPGPLTVEVEPAAVAPSVEAPTAVTVRVDRDASLKKEVRVELIVPSHMRGISADPIRIAADTDQATLQIRFAADAGPFNAPLTIRAVHGEGVEQVVAESTLELIAPRR